MVELQVFYRKRNQFGRITVSERDTFRSVKERVLLKYSDHSDCDEAVFSACLVELPQPFLRQRRRSRFTPCETASVLELLERLSATSIFGKICLTILDKRGANATSFAPLPADEQLHTSLLATSDKPENYGEENSCTSWAMTRYNAIGTGSTGAVDAEKLSSASGSNAESAVVTVPWLFEPVSVLESLFNELTSTAVIQGRLQKKIFSPRKQEIWREEYCILDGRTSRLWHFPIAADTPAAGSSFKELGVSGLGVPSHILLLNGCNTKAQESVTVATHRSDPTSFTVTITDDWLLNPAAAKADRLYSDQRSHTFRASTAEKAGKWVSRFSQLHGMLHQPLLPPGTDNPRLFTPTISQFVQSYCDGSGTFLAAAEKAFLSQTSSASASHFHHSITTSLAACGGGGTEDGDDPYSAPIPVTARCASHWANNCMLESIEDCIAVTQQTNTQRDQDRFEMLMTFEGMLKSKYLRGYFQKFLANNCTEETLLFWEYAEDYWRAHPYSQQPFSTADPARGAFGYFSAIAGGRSTRHGVANEILEALRRQDAVMLAPPEAVRQWAESIFLTFLHANAPYQIGCCTAGDVERISTTIDALGEDDLPPFNLFRSVQLATFAFMKQMLYPDFVAQPGYYRLLVAAVHAADRVAANGSILASCVASDREVAAFDLSVGSEDPSPPSSAPSTPASTTSATSTAGGISTPATAASRRGLLGIMKDMVIKRMDTGPVAAPTDSARELSTKVNNKNYAARWRVTKLVVFDMVRNGIPITPTATSTATATALSAGSNTSGNALYRICRRHGKHRSIIGDKVRKLQALQRGIVRKIGWLPEWWWDLLPPVDVSGELDDQVLDTLSDLVADSADAAEGEDTERERLLSESTLLDEAEDPFEKDRSPSPSSRGGKAAGLDPWAWLTHWDGCDWIAKDMNSISATMAKTRRGATSEESLVTANSQHSSSRDLHLELLFRRLQAGAEEAQGAKPGRLGSLFLPAGWKPDASSMQNAEAIKRAVLHGAGAQQPAQDLPLLVKYSPSIPRCVSQINFTSGRILLCDYAHFQPEGFHMRGALAGLGTMIACSVARCRFVRPAGKPAPTLLRGYSKRASSGPLDRSSESSVAPSGNASPARSSVVRTGGGLVVTQTESVVIDDCPQPVLLPGATAFVRAALQSSSARAPRWEEFYVPGGNASACNDWPRQCIVLYVCLGVPKLHLVDPVTHTPSACIDIHNVRRIGPSERYLQAIELQDSAGSTWQISPEGLDGEDTREAPRRWLQTLATLCLPATRAIYVLKAGYLHKRGQVNRAYKLRWFVLTSDLKLRYYKDDQAGMWKGTIDLSSSGASSEAASTPGSASGVSSNGSEASSPPGGVVRFDKEIVVTMQSTQRMFKLLAEDVATAEDWLAVIKDLLRSPFATAGSGADVGIGEGSRHSESLLEDQGDADDDDGDDD